MEVVVQVIISSLSLGSFYALGALGIGLLFGVLRLINFAHGDFITVGGFSLIVPATAVVAVPLILDFHPVALIICVVGVVVIWALEPRQLLRPRRAGYRVALRRAQADQTSPTATSSPSAGSR